MSTVAEGSISPFAKLCVRLAESGTGAVVMPASVEKLSGKAVQLHYIDMTILRLETNIMTFYNGF